MKNVLLSVLISVALSTVVFFYFNTSGQTKIGYIKSGMVLQEYKEMKAVSDQFNKELLIVQTNLDTLRRRYERLKAMEANVPPKAQKDWLYQLEVAQKEYDKYNQQASQQMAARKQELTKNVLETVNSFIQQYGKANNYKLILGTTDDGSILYGNEADDITQVILEQLNGAYATKANSTDKK